VQTLLESLQWETRSVVKKGNLYRLRDIAKSANRLSDEDITTDYVNYLTTSPTKLIKVKYDGSR